MPSQIYLHDIGRKVDVDDTFFEMDEAQQGQYIHGIVQQYNSMNPSVIENLRAGTSRVGQGIQNTLKKDRSGSDVLDFIGGAVKAGTDIVGGTPETNRALDPNNPFAMPTVTDVAADPIKNLPNWVAGAVGDALPTMAAATVAASPLGRFGAAAQAVGGMGAATLLSGITDFGSTADSIANRNGREKPNDDDYNEAIAVTGATALFDGVASYYGIKSGAAKNLVLGAVSTGGTVGLQKVAATGELPNAEELLDSTLRGAVGAEGAARGIRAVQNIGPTVQKYQVGSEYSNNPDQVMSDARVGKLFQGRSGAEKQFDRGWDVNADETFKGIKADIKSHLEDLTDVSRRAGDVTTEQSKQLKEITSRAAKHNHSLAEGGQDHAYFQTEIDAVRQMGLPPHTERAYIDALRDLETVSYNSMKKNAKGPAERVMNTGISKGLGGAIGMGLGSSVGGPTGAWVGAGIGGLIPGRIGRAIDTATGSRQPPVLRRIEARNAYLKGKNINPGDTVSQLQNAITDAQGRVKVVRPGAPRTGSPLSARLNEAGTPRIGGWQKAVIDSVNDALGYRVVGTKELHDTIDEAVQLGDLKQEDADALKSRGNNEVDSQLMYDLSDIMAEKYGKGFSKDVPTSRTGDQAEPKATEGSGIRNEYAYRQTMSNVKDATQAAIDGAGTPEMRSSIAEIANARTPTAKKALLNKLLAENPEQADFINKQVGPLTDFGPKDKPSTGPKMMSGIDPKDVKEKLFDPAVAGVKSMAKAVSDALTAKPLVEHVERSPDGSSRISVDAVDNKAALRRLVESPAGKDLQVAPMKFPSFEGTPKIKAFRDAFTSAITQYRGLNDLDRAASSRAADATLRTVVGPLRLISPNAKMSKASKGYKGGEPIKLGDGRTVETTGLSLAPAYEEGGFKTCPNSAPCASLCLGKTSGNYYVLGGGADLSKLIGPRLNSLLRTKGMMKHPEAFAVRLFDEIAEARDKARRNNSILGIRLNVLSDINPQVHRSLIEAFPDVIFYDYTKNNTDPIAPNHHYTYSSTGFSHNGVDNPHQNWKQMRKRLEGGDNVAMAFSHKSELPTSIYDEETGKTYTVVDGDTHDFRPLDIQPVGSAGVIVGLRNKAANLSQGSASKDTNGFFVHYDPQFETTKKGTQVRDADGKPIARNKKVVVPVQGKSKPAMTNDGESA